MSNIQNVYVDSSSVFSSLLSQVTSLNTQVNSLPTSTTRGPQGLAGSNGLRGFQGSGQGGTGPTGMIGPTGPSGNIGPQGLLGSTGSKGFTGFIGLQGAQGSSGLIGLQGPTGPLTTGLRGSTGSMGIQGFMGFQGSTGDAGPINMSTGPQGLPGNTGGALFYYEVLQLQAFDIGGGTIFFGVNGTSFSGGTPNANIQRQTAIGGSNNTILIPYTFNKGVISNIIMKTINYDSSHVQTQVVKATTSYYPGNPGEYDIELKNISASNGENFNLVVMFYYTLV